MKPFLLLVLVSCAGAAPMKPINKTAPEPIAFVRGPTISAELGAWLDQQPGIIRLPVTFAANEARVGTLRLELDDSALGISLADRRRQFCPNGDCTLWLEGRWKGGGKFWLSRVDRAVTEGEPADFVENESESAR